MKTREAVLGFHYAERAKSQLILAQRLIARVTGQPFERGIDELDDSLRVCDHDTLGCLFDGCDQPLPLLTRPLTLGIVPGEGAVVLLVAELQEVGHDLHREDGSVLPAVVALYQHRAVYCL